MIRDTIPKFGFNQGKLLTVRSPNDSDTSQPSRINLWWLPVNAGEPGRLSEIAAGWWERIEALRNKRQPQKLFHAALEVFSGDERYVIEMAAELRGPDIPHGGVAARGPVGFRPLGHFSLFRYEVRCWTNGEFADRPRAIAGPIMLSQDDGAVTTVLGCIENVPVLTWGRTVHATGDMWTSNSLISWLLIMAGIECADLVPPEGGRAPGWAAGIAVAQQADEFPTMSSRDNSMFSGS